MGKGQQHGLGEIKDPKIKTLKAKTEQAEPKFKMVFSNLESFVAERLREINALSESFKFQKQTPQIKTLAKLNDKSYDLEVEFYQLARNLVIINKAKSKFLCDKEYVQHASNISQNDELLSEGLKNIYLYNLAINNKDYSSADAYLDQLNKTTETLRQNLLKEDIDYLIKKAEVYLLGLKSKQVDNEKSVAFIDDKLKKLQSPPFGKITNFFFGFIKEDYQKYNDAIKVLDKTRRSRLELLANMKHEIEVTERFKNVLASIKELSDIYKLAYSLEDVKQSPFYKKELAL